MKTRLMERSTLYATDCIIVCQKPSCSAAKTSEVKKKNKKKTFSRQN